ncbi:MAG: tRNA pseudouridine(55) synthase TruB [Saprospiraceae bacterium]|nr:tRNA pseudouridine(55) synthase TruB [Saprospiraceae bacterium]
MLTVISPGQPFPDPFPKGAVFLIDKPLAWTSFGVVNKVRYLLARQTGNKKLKVGHAGTLDPLATGLLILCVGDYTKRIEEFQSMPKTYAGTITFGATTPSFDLEKAPDTPFPTAHLTKTVLETARQQFLGDILQVPPVFSAVKVDGRRLYKNARTGQEVEMPHRPVRIDSFELLGDLHPIIPGLETSIIASKKGSPIMLHPDYPAGLQIDFQVVCSKGTYIRSLANDFGQAVGSGAYLSKLQRTAIGDFTIENAWSVDELAEWAGSPQL